MFGRQVAPATVPTDTVIPFRFFDDTPLWRTIILYSMFVFDDVISPEKLRDSLEKLAQRDGWTRLGARMRKNVSEKRRMRRREADSVCSPKETLSIMCRPSSQRSAELFHMPMWPMI